MMSFTRTKISLEKSKTDIYREGSWVLIAKTFTNMSSEYARIIFSKISNFPRHLNSIYLFLVLRSVKRKISTFFRKKNKLLSCTRTILFSLLFRKLFTKIKYLGYKAFVPKVQQQLPIEGGICQILGRYVPCRTKKYTPNRGKIFY